MKYADYTETIINGVEIPVKAPEFFAFSLLVLSFNDAATTEVYTLSLHDALPICARGLDHPGDRDRDAARDGQAEQRQDRKSTRLNSSHSQISYAVFCLKKKKHYSNRSIYV